MTRTLIVYCHPYAGSFNHAVLETVEANLKRQQQRYQLIDLHADGFDPRYDAEELRLFHEGGTHDPLVVKYLELLRETHGLIVITPIWWNEIPGMLKGFVDKVMKEGEELSHVVTRTGIRGRLTNIAWARVYTTSTSPTWYYRLFMGDGVKRIFLNHTLRQLGVKHRRWRNFGGITGSTADRRQHYLSSLSRETWPPNPESAH